MDYLKSLLELIKSEKDLSENNHICISLEDIAKCWNRIILLQRSLTSEEFLKKIFLALRKLEDKNAVRLETIIVRGHSKKPKSLEEIFRLKSLGDKLCLEIKEDLSSSTTPILSPALKKITVIEPRIKSSRFLIVLNSHYEKPLSEDKIKSGRLLYEIAKEKSVPFVNFKKADIDYFNSNKRNKIYTQSHYGLTRIFKRDGGYISPNIKIDIITEKAFKTRQNKQSKA